MLEMRGDSETIVVWVNGHAALKTRESTIASVQNLLREWLRRAVDLGQRVADWAIHMFREHNKEADSWTGKSVKSVKKNGWTSRTLSGLKSPVCAVSGTVARWTKPRTWPAKSKP